MAAITLQTVVKTGITPSYAAASAGGDTFVNNGKTFLIVKNANAAAARAVTVDSKVDCNQGSTHDLVVSVPAESEEWIGPFAPSRFNSSTGSVEVTYDSQADLTVAAISL